MDSVGDAARKNTRWFNCSNRTVAVMLVAVGVAVGVLVIAHYRVHLWWLIQEHRLDLHEFMSVPDTPMPHAIVSNSWVRCQVGCVQFSLPPDLAANRRNQGLESAMFQFGTRNVYVSSPVLASEVLNLDALGASHTFTEFKGWTIPRIKLECYRINSETFNWSMSPLQVRRYAFLVALRQIVRTSEELGTHIEYFHGDDIDAMALFVNGGIVLDWESRIERVGGYIRVVDSKIDVDRNWVRSLCGSISVSHVHGQSRDR